MNTKAFFSFLGGSNLIVGTGMENEIFFLRTPATMKFFHQILKSCHWCKNKNHYPPRLICMTHIWTPTLFSRGIIIFKGVLTKFNFLMKFLHLEKFVELMKDLKYEHQSILLLWGRSNLILGTGSEKQIFFLRTSADVNFFHQIIKK